MTAESDAGLPLAPLVTVAVLGALHFLARPLLVSWWGAPDLAVAGVLVATLHLRGGQAAVAGFVLGLLDEAMGLEQVGPLAALYALAGYLGARSWEVIMAETWLFLPLYLAFGSWMLILANTYLTSFDLSWNYALTEAPVSAVLTAAVAGLASRAAGGSG